MIVEWMELLRFCALFMHVNNAKVIVTEYQLVELIYCYRQPSILYNTNNKYLKEDDMSKSSSWFFGALLGGLVGTALARLYAPYPGEELKAKICDYVQNVRYEVEQAGVEKRAELEAQLEELRSGKA